MHDSEGAPNRRAVTAESGGAKPLIAGRDAGRPGAWETFTLTVG